MIATDWWAKPRKINVVVDNESWILPYAATLVDILNRDGDNAQLIRDHDGIKQGGISFFLGCVKITPKHVLNRSHRNLVVHASDLPAGRGFSPLTWQILEGKNRIPVCLIEAVDEVDAGPIVERAWIDYNGSELNDELRKPLGQMHIDLCKNFLAHSVPFSGIEQVGKISTYKRRRPSDSRLDPKLSIADQFNLLRVADNERYPVYFDFAGSRYILRIEKTSET